MGDPGLAFSDIGRALAGRGFRLTEDIYDEKDFGSRYMVFSGSNRSVRLLWDGKEESLIVETRDAGEDAWRHLKTEKVGRATASVGNIAALKAALDEIK